MRMKLFAVLAAMTALSTSVFAASSSALVFILTTEICNGSGHLGFCWNSGGLLQELKGEQSITLANAAGVEILLLSNIAGAAVDIHCKKASGAGTLGQANALLNPPVLGLVITIEECKLEGTLGMKCKIPASKTTNNLSGTFVSKTLLRIKPTTGTVFITIPFENITAGSCPVTIRGARDITGEQDFTILNPEIHENTKTLECVKMSNLQLDEESVECDEGKLVMSFTGLGDEVDFVETA